MSDPWEQLPMDIKSRLSQERVKDGNVLSKYMKYTPAGADPVSRVKEAFGLNVSQATTVVELFYEAGGSQCVSRVVNKLRHARGLLMSSASSGFKLAQSITPKIISYCRSFMVSEEGAFAAGTILTSTCVATFAHGAHAEWKVGEKKAYKRFFPKEDASPFEATVVEVNKDSDYILLKVDAKIGLPCPEVTPYLYMRMPYVVLGMSARSHHDLASCCVGHVISSDLDRHGFLHGRSGARLGDSGAPAFVIGESTLVAMNVASAAAFGETLNRDERGLCVASGASCKNVMVLASKLLLAARDLGL